MNNTTIKDFVLNNYGHLSPAVVRNLMITLNHGKLGGSGNAIFYPVDQQLEHGHSRTFGKNPSACDPRYIAQLAIDAGFNAIAISPGGANLIAREFASQIPIVMKLNSRWAQTGKGSFDQAYLASVEHAAQMGCAGIGLTVYPGSIHADEMLEEARAAIDLAHSLGLYAVVWGYSRGEGVDKLAEDNAARDALDITADVTRLICELGADIVKVKFPSDVIANQNDEVQSYYEDKDTDDPTWRAQHICDSAMGGNRLVLFSGGEAKGGDSKKERDDAALSFYQTAAAIRDGGCLGSICGRNVTKRERPEALAFVDGLVEVYGGASPEEAIKTLQAVG